MGGGKKCKLDKAFKPLRDKFDKATQEKQLVSQKRRAQQRESSFRERPKNEFDQMAHNLHLRTSGTKKNSSKRTLVLAPPIFSLVSHEAETSTAQPQETKMQYSADRYLAGESIRAAPKVNPKEPALLNRFTLLEEEEEEKMAPLLLKPAFGFGNGT
jgi:hypothetical protein